MRRAAIVILLSALACRHAFHELDNRVHECQARGIVFALAVCGGQPAPGAQNCAAAASAYITVECLKKDPDEE